MNHGQCPPIGSAGFQAAQHRQRDKVIATCCHWGNAAFADLGVEGGDPRHAVGKIDRVWPDIAKVGAIDRGKGIDPGNRIQRPEHW